MGSVASGNARLALCHSLHGVSDVLAYSFSDPGAGRHCFGFAGGPTLVLDAGVASSHASAELVRADPELGRWEVALDGGFAVLLEALGPPIDFAAETRREWLCRCSGSAQAGGSEVTLSGFGHVALGSPALNGLTLRRNVWGYFDEELAFALAAERPSSASGHGEERLEAFVGRGLPLATSPVADPRLSASYGPDGTLLRSGLELWESDDDDARPLRIAGETVAAGELRGLPAAIGGEDSLRVSVAFLVFHHARQTGVGCYEIVRASA
jgi:hypothetical protein